MNKKVKIASLALALAACASCTQHQRPEAIGDVRPLTGNVYTCRHDVKMVCGRAHGESYGFSLLGIIPITKASEAEAVDRMYENAQKRGASLEGPRQFVNTSYEKSANYFILGSRPVVRVAADLVEIQGEAPAATVEAAPTKPSINEEKGFVGMLQDFVAVPFKLYGEALDSIFGA